jgi:glycosyltransferase involved in cell wall biosynthesis
MLPPSAFVEELQAAEVPLHAPHRALIPSLLRRMRPQIVHCHMFHANMLGRLLRLVMPFPALISTLHSAAESKRSTGRVRHRDVLYRLTDRLSDATVAVSQAVAARHLSANAARCIEVIPNGVDTETFRPDKAVREHLRRGFGLEKEFVWLAAGRLMWKKNYPALLRAFSDLGAGVLLIAGSGPDEAALRALATPRVRFLGERRDLPALMNAADGFVLSSVVEGLPVALLEAAATGLPAVSTDVGGVREVGAGLVVAPADLPRAMASLTHMPEDKRRALGEAARRRVVDHYSIDAVVSQWETLYRRLTEWM